MIYTLKPYLYYDKYLSLLFMKYDGQVSHLRDLLSTHEEHIDQSQEDA